MAEKMVDKVMRIMKCPDKIRNIAICAHIDHGKTTFSDNLLSGAGMMSGDLAGKARLLDFHEDEIARGITIDSASVSMVHTFNNDEYLINLIDTPGHVDFGGDVTRAMRAVDGCIVLVCASEGIMPQTETVLRQALKEKVKPILFINKVDRLIKELQLTPEQMQERFIKIITSLNQFVEGIAPEGEADRFKVQVQDGSVCFGSAFHNWALSVPYMKKAGISFKEIIEAYQGESEAYKELKKKAPIHEIILNAVITHLPNPTQAQKYRIPKLWHGDLESEDGKSLLNCDPNGPLYFVVTKIVVDPQAGEIAAGRLFSGTMKKGTAVYLNRAKLPLRVQQVFVYNGAKREIVDNVPSGNIIGVAGLKSMPGETVTLRESEPFEEISHLFEPVVTIAVEAKKPSDLPRLIEVLRQVNKEDPTLKVEINEETGEHLLSGMGELHLEVIENRIKTEKGVDIKTSPPIVVYRESVLKKGQEAMGKSPNKHNHIFFTVEPLPENVIQAIAKGELPSGRIKKKEQVITVRDKMVELGFSSKIADRVKDVYNGNILMETTRGIVYLPEIIELVLDMFEEVMRAGPIAREPCTKLLVTLTDCKLHEDAIHRGPAQMYPAVREGIKEAMNTSAQVLYEPVQELLFEAPVIYIGDISKLVSAKRGQLLDMQQEGEMVAIKARMPVAEQFGLSNDLRSATGGRGSNSLVNQTFERLPGELQNKIITQIRTRKGLTENQ